MLAISTPFPQVGSHAFLKPNAEPVRIQRRNDDDTALISFTGEHASREAATGNKTVPLADLVEKREDAFAMAATRKYRRGARK